MSESTFQSLLITIALGKPNERWVAARKYVKLNKEAPSTLLLEVYTKGGIDTKKAVLFIIGKLNNGVQHSEVLINGLKHENDSVFRTACETARDLKSCSVAELIVKGLKSQSIGKIKSALYGLEYAWSDVSFESVFQLYKNHSSIEVRKSAGYPLNINVSELNWCKIFSAFSKDKIDRHRIWAGKIAYKYGDSSVINSLENLEKDKNGHVRWYAKLAIKRINENKL